MNPRRDRPLPVWSTRAIARTALLLSVLGAGCTALLEDAKSPEERGWPVPGAAGVRAPVRWDLTASPTRARPGELVDIVLVALIEPGWWVTPPEEGPGGFSPLDLDIDLPEGFRIIGDWEQPAPEPVDAGGRGAYAGRALFRRLLEVDRSASPGRRQIRVTAAWSAGGPDQVARAEVGDFEVTVEILPAPPGSGR